MINKISKRHFHFNKHYFIVTSCDIHTIIFYVKNYLTKHKKNSSDKNHRGLAKKPQKFKTSQDERYKINFFKKFVNIFFDLFYICLTNLTKIQNNL